MNDFAENLLRAIPDTIVSKCPSCKESSFFSFIGIQSWPEQVARSANIPMHVALYECGNCKTCITEQSLQVQRTATASRLLPPPHQTVSQQPTDEQGPGDQPGQQAPTP